jgi:membrane protein implicated in regulation of membrane protease activity
VKQEPPPASVADLATNALYRITDLIRGELDLARAEAVQAVRIIGIGLALILGATILALSALNVAAGAIVAVLVANGISPPLAAALVTVAFAAAALVLALAGVKALKSSTDAPRRVAKNLRRDANTVQESISNDL